MNDCAMIFPRFPSVSPLYRCLRHNPCISVPEWRNTRTADIRVLSDRSIYTRDKQSCLWQFLIGFSLFRTSDQRRRERSSSTRSFVPEYHSDCQYPHHFSFLSFSWKKWKRTLQKQNYSICQKKHSADFKQ